MPNIELIAGLTAGILSFVAYAPYVAAILRGQTKPNRATWIIWVTTSGSIFFSSLASGSSDTLWMPGCYMMCSFWIALLSLKYGEGGWTNFDRHCLFAAALGLALWWILDAPLIALTIATAVDVIGALPTIRKSYYEPEGEDGLAWMLFFLGSIVNVLAVSSWTFAIAFYPVTMVLLIGIIAALVVGPWLAKIVDKKA